MEKLINTLLMQDDGISERAFNALHDKVDKIKNKSERAKLKKLLASADATDGRFYFPL